MSLLAHPHALSAEPRATLRLLEQPRRATRVKAPSVPSVALSRPEPWLDRQLQRLAAWAEERATLQPPRYF